MRESYDEKKGIVYFDAEIKRLHTLAEMHERGVNEINGRKCWMTYFFVNPVLVNKLESDAWCEQNFDAGISLSVEDNGVDGDGFRLNIDLIDTGKGFGGEDDGAIVSVCLSPRQAMILSRALEGVARMRDFDKGLNDE